jgi:hypothetical protein
MPLFLLLLCRRNAIVVYVIMLSQFVVLHSCTHVNPIVVEDFFSKITLTSNPWYHLESKNTMCLNVTYVCNLLNCMVVVVFMWWCSYDVFLHVVGYELSAYSYSLMHCFLEWIYYHPCLFVVCPICLCDCEITLTTCCWVSWFKFRRSLVRICDTWERVLEFCVFNYPTLVKRSYDVYFKLPYFVKSCVFLTTLLYYYFSDV